METRSVGTTDLKTPEAPSKLVEVQFPVGIISRDSAIEMSFKPRSAYIARCKELDILPNAIFYDPKIRSLHPWLARRSRSAARALNLASLVPADTPLELFLRCLGFSKEKLEELARRGYPPIISFSKPNPSLLRIGSDTTILDPMAGGGSIPLESAVLGIKTMACEYNPVAFLLLRATVEFPAKYGLELWRNVRSEAKGLLQYCLERLTRFYRRDERGYIILRQVEHGRAARPVTISAPLTRSLHLRIENGKPILSEGRCKMETKRDLLGAWMRQHVEVLKGRRELYNVVHRCVAVQIPKGFRAADQQDQDLMDEAYAEYLRRKDSLPLPRTPLFRDNVLFEDLLPLRTFDNLFSPRQALALGEAMDYVRSRAETLAAEGEFGVAVLLYLAFGIDRLADFNSIITTWNHYQGTVRDSIGSYYKFRKLRVDGVYAEAVPPHRTLPWIYEPEVDVRTTGGICPVLKELCEKLEGKGDRVSVYMADVLELSKRFRNAVDVVNVDPPYYNQHVYSDFSEFFWPLLQATLAPVIETLFKDRVLIDWTPEDRRVPKSNEVISRDSNTKVFETRLSKALQEMTGVMKDDGLLLLWFSHKDIEAWITVVRALRSAQLKVTNIIPLVSEHPTRSITKGGVAGINRVLITVARKTGSVDAQSVLERLSQWIRQAKLYPSEDVPEAEVRYLVSVASKALETSSQSDT